jgi:hypothetical protein
MDLGQDKREKPLSQRNDEIAEKHAHTESVKNILEQKLAKDAKVRLALRPSCASPFRPDVMIRKSTAPLLAFDKVADISVGEYHLGEFA